MSDPDFLGQPAEPGQDVTLLIGDCDTVRGNALDHPVSWNGSSDLAALRGRNIHLRFFIKSAYLFAFRFAEAST